MRGERADVPRILRNYIISFIIIGLFFLVAHLINRYVEEHTPAPQAPATDAAAPSAAAPAATPDGSAGGTVAPDPPSDGKY
jgi:hypothetical protein